MIFQRYTHGLYRLPTEFIRRIELVHGFSSLFAVVELAGVWGRGRTAGGAPRGRSNQPAHCVTVRRPDRSPAGDARPCHSGPPRTGCRGAGKHLRLAPEAPIARPDRCGAWVSRPTRRHRAVCRPRPPTLPAPLTGARCACVAQSPHNDTSHHTTTQTRASTRQRQQQQQDDNNNRTTTTTTTTGRQRQQQLAHHRPTTGPPQVHDTVMRCMRHQGPTRGPPGAHHRPTTGPPHCNAVHASCNVRV